MRALFEIPEAAQARALHARRELHQALEWGFAFLDAFDLAPAALDIIDGAIARMDEVDAIDEDKEPWLNRPIGMGPHDPDVPLDAECEPEHDEDFDPAEGTSLETFGRGFVRCGEDDAEQDDEPEDDELGDEHARPMLEWVFGSKRAEVVYV